MFHTIDVFNSSVQPTTKTITHDHAVVDTLLSTYPPFKVGRGDLGMKLVVLHVQTETT